MSEETKKLMDMKYKDLWKKYRNLVTEYEKVCEELKKLKGDV